MLGPPRPAPSGVFLLTGNAGWWSFLSPSALGKPVHSIQGATANGIMLRVSDLPGMRFKWRSTGGGTSSGNTSSIAISTGGGLRAHTKDGPAASAGLSGSCCRRG